MKPGLVSIVGAGPGDPGLLTLKAADRIRRAQAVVHDALVHPEILALAPASARRFYVGKRKGRHVMPQSRINRVVARLSRLGLRVVRLKGGDPFVFGRGAEECESLARAGLPWELVPGVSSCLAAPAYAGIPVTDRRHSSMVTILSGHECGANARGVDWDMVSPRGTLVVLMGFSRLKAICDRLISLGWDEKTPAAALSAMGWDSELVAVSDLGDLPRAASSKNLASPAVIVVGEVVRLRRWLNWREGEEHKEESCRTSKRRARPAKEFTFRRPKSFPGIPARSGRPGRSLAR